MDAYREAERIAIKWSGKALNEADTRHQIIDVLLHDVLAWPRDSVKCEPHVVTGYIDYVFRNATGRGILIIEAKKTGKAFTLPIRISSRATGLRKVLLRTLATDPEIRKTILQVSSYSLSIGNEFACVTNGNCFILFRTFVKGKDYLDSDAIVIPTLKSFHQHFTEIRNLLSYTAVTSERSLTKAFDPNFGESRDLYFPKDAIPQYDSHFSENSYARYLDPIARHYFDDIKATDFRLMERCYVFGSGTSDAIAGLETRITDALSPFFAADGGQELTEKRDGGAFTRRIATSLTTPKTDVLILFGGKGSGKSTFLRRLLYVQPPVDIQLYCFPIVIDFLQVPQDEKTLTDYAWKEAVKGLDNNNLLGGEVEGLVDLFSDRFSVASKQELSGYDPGSIEYIRERNHLILKWKSDLPYVVRRLQQYWLSRRKSLTVVFDNTDQLRPKLQDHCFLLAQNFARELDCSVVISMREERYCRARTLGVLDAYHNSGFHLSAPNLKLLFTKRINQVIRDLEGGKKHLPPSLPEDTPFENLVVFFKAMARQFREPSNAMQRFLVECSRDNARRALDFFRQFLTSGYTHVAEIIDNPMWTVIDHQVIRPMMIPTRYNYDENKSLIPNLFQCRSSNRGSHFTALRILRLLRQGGQSTSDFSNYWSVTALCDEFESRYSMREDCESCLDVMLRHSIIEANNRLDSLRVESSTKESDQKGMGEFIYADEVRTTAFGLYAADVLSHSFTYIDLVAHDCGIASEQLFNLLRNSAIEERRLGSAGQKIQRLEKRFARTRAFLEYLSTEELREREQFDLSSEDEFIPAIQAQVEYDISRAEASARKHYKS